MAWGLTRTRRALANLVADWRGVDLNARRVLLFEPLFGVPFNCCVAYAVLYRSGLGLSAQQIGLLASLASASSMLCSLVAGAACDRLGRRRVGLIFGLLGFALPHLIYAFAHTFVTFAVGVLISGMWTVEATAWQCVIVDDTPPDSRVNLFRWANIAMIVSGLATPLAGIFASRYGVVPAARGLYFFAAACMTLMFVWRYLATSESSVGLQRMQDVKEHSGRETLSDIISAARTMLSSRTMLCLFLAQQALNFYGQSAGLYFSLYARAFLGVGVGLVSAFPFVASAMQLVAFLFVVPRLAQRPLRNMLAGAAVSLLGIGVLAACPRGWLLLLFGTTLATALGYAVVQPFISTAWNNSIPDERRAKVLSLTWVLGNLVCLPAGYVAGELYAHGPRLPFVLGVGLYGLAIALLVTAFAGRAKRTPPRAASPAADAAV